MSNTTTSTNNNIEGGICRPDTITKIKEEYTITTEKCKVTVIDALMGSGKTEWSIQHINSNQFENIIYITPFLNEVDRIIENTNREFQQPVNRGKGKLVALNELLACQVDIASTHELFKHLDENSKNAIKEGHYTLILDEVLNVIEPFDVRANDLQILKDSSCITIDNDGFVLWNETKKDYDTRYNEIKFLAENKSLICVNNKLLLWRYPPEIFELFDGICILTYLFEASILKSYFDLYKIQYEKKSIKHINGSYCIVDYFIPDTSVFVEKINIYHGTYNENFSQKSNALSKTWFNARINKQNTMQLKKNLYNYFRYALHAKADTIMWSTFKDFQSKLRGKGYSNGFVSFNCRSTNKHIDKYNLAYAVNVYIHPAITQLFQQRNIEINEELYALSEMLQWIWRSRIRKGENINIYIPSMRMRQLLNNWLNMSLEYQHDMAA